MCYVSPMRGALGLVCLLVLVAAPATPRAQACLPPTVTLLVDRSSSMRFDLDTDDDVRSKWSIQRDALLDLATNHQAKLALGLTVLPRFTGDCTPASQRIVGPAIFQKAVIATALARMVPETDAWSPIGQAFVELGEADDTGRVVTAGGRVLGVTALGDTLDAARAAAYRAADLIAFDGKVMRRDIGKGAT